MEPKLSATEKRFLEILWYAPSDGLSTGSVGLEAWGDRPGSTTRNLQNYARPAGAVLRRLQRKGLVGQSGEMCWWVLTGDGRKAQLLHRDLQSQQPQTGRCRGCGQVIGLMTHPQRPRQMIALVHYLADGEMCDGSGRYPKKVK